MWPFKKKPDVWRAEVDLKLGALFQRTDAIGRDVQRRALGIHNHPLPDYNHSLTPHEHPHEHLLQGRVVAQDNEPVLTGRIACPGCEREYDLQEDCHAGATRHLTIVCTACGCEFEVDGRGQRE